VDRIFERFRSGTQLGGSRGTGLGLALVRAVAKAHGGEVEVRSVPGGGSEFALLLPVLPVHGGSGSELTPDEEDMSGAGGRHAESGAMAEGPWTGRAR
jgi:hypothetical protein